MFRPDLPSLTISLFVLGLCADPVRAVEGSFSHQVMAVLSKAGCNAGACHGNAAGKGGFRLSLRGQDPNVDHLWITRESGGRRINLIEPNRSLILLKPTGQVSHQGGIRFRRGSQEYEILCAWLEAGALPPDRTSPRVTRIQVTPAHLFLLAPEDSIQLQVVAHFADGTQRDVTSLATFELSNMVADVLADGLVRRKAFGEATVMVRYLNQQAPARVAFVPLRQGFRWTNPPANNFIDDLVYEKLRQLRMNPSALTSDQVFVRRAYLDAIGVLPTAEEARRFVSDQRVTKRAALINQLLKRSEFADHWALKWSDILRNEEKVLDPQGVDAFHGWIRESVASGKPMDRFVRELLRGQGSTYENPAANYWRANRDASLRGETTARLFLGTRLQCAKCHNHPFDRWTQDDYYRWAALFARIDYEIVNNERKDRFDKNEFNGEQRVVFTESGGVDDPRTGHYATPKLLGDRFLSPGSYHDRLTPLAVWLTDSSNVRFAEVQVNFVWYHLLGRGLVDPIDDFRSTNPASNPALLTALSRDYAEHEFDLRHLVRTIMNSRVYQLSADPNGTNVDDELNFSHATIYRLPAEKLLDAQSTVLDLPAEFAGYARGMRAGQLPGVRRIRLRDGRLRPGDRFLKAFGKPERLLACECERSNETTLAQTFLLIGGDLHQRLAHPGNRLARLAFSPASDQEIVEELYWTALSRGPTSAEVQAAVELLRSAEGPFRTIADQAWARLFAQFGWVKLPDDRFSRVQDLAWALLNSKEFVLRR